MFSVTLFSWWQWVCASAILELRSNNPAKGNWLSFKKVGQRRVSNNVVQKVRKKGWKGGFDRTWLKVVKKEKKIHSHSTLCFPRSTSFERKKGVHQSPNSPLFPCYLNCSKFFTTAICHCARWTYIPVFCAYIFDNCTFLWEWWQGWNGPFQHTLQVQHIYIH